MKIQDRARRSQIFVHVSLDEYFAIVDYAPPSDGDDHIFVPLTAPLPKSKAIRWYLHGEHAQLKGTEPSNNLKNEPASKPIVESYGPKISIPGISRPVGIYELVYFKPTECNFSCAELTKVMDEVLAFLGDRPIRITSGYRDPQSNRYVARDSRHMYGDSVDSWVEGLDVFYQLKDYHPHGGLAVGKGLCM